MEDVRLEPSFVFSFSDPIIPLVLLLEIADPIRCLFSGVEISLKRDQAGKMKLSACVTTEPVHGPAIPIQCSLITRFDSSQRA